LAQARAGRGAFVVVEGRAGIGTTALLAAARTTAANEGMRVLRAGGAELERDFAFGVVRQLFEPVLADASDSNAPICCKARPASPPRKSCKALISGGSHRVPPSQRGVTQMFFQRSLDTHPTPRETTATVVLQAF
jgi:hypothetical protein